VCEDPAVLFAIISETLVNVYNCIIILLDMEFVLICSWVVIFLSCFHLNNFDM
jgi:hypothetical protein